MKMNAVKKDIALRRIKSRRQGDMMDSQNNNITVEREEDGFVQLPDGILPRNAEVLRSEYTQVIKKSYSIMEWWRLTTNEVSADIGTPRFKVFGSWGKFLLLIALCVPSSAAVERVFSLLKLCKRKNKMCYAS